MQLAKNQMLQTTETGFIRGSGRHRTTLLWQEDIENVVAVGVAKKRFSFDVPYGPYKCAYTANGQHLLAGGRKGQVAFLHCETMKISAELQLKETIRAVQPLHSHMMFAVAQSKHVYIYDHSGVELHCLKGHDYTSHLDFLPYHYLLVTSGEYSDLRYRDISTGQEVCVHKTRLGPTRSLRQNPGNAVMHVGHSDGTVTLWTPTVNEPVVKMLCHRGHVTGLAIHGHYMVSTGAEGLWRVWDLRNYQKVHTFRTYGHAGSDVDVSMTGIVGLGFGSHVQLWKDVLNQGVSFEMKPYMKKEYPGRCLSSLRFRPYEDICSVGHSDGFGSIIVPGAGFANFDSFEANPFETRKQRREREVHTLLEKLQPDSIMLNPNLIGSVDKGVVQKYTEEVKIKAEAEAKKKVKKKMRGKNRIGKRMKKKSLKVVKEQRKKAKSRLNGEDLAESDGSHANNESDKEAEEICPDVLSASGPDRTVSGALSRFYGKRRRKT